MKRLADLMDRYGQAIAADLARQGWDVVQLVDAGRWKFTLALVDHLPRTSSYVQAVSQDDEIAEAAGHVPPSLAGPSLTEWTPEVEALAAVIDRLGEVINGLRVIHPSGKGKAVHVPPYRRPTTAFDRARIRREVRLSEAAIAKAFPSQVHNRR